MECASIRAKQLARPRPFQKGPENAFLMWLLRSNSYNNVHVFFLICMATIMLYTDTVFFISVTFLDSV